MGIFLYKKTFINTLRVYWFIKLQLNLQRWETPKIGNLWRSRANKSGSHHGAASPSRFPFFIHPPKKDSCRSSCVSRKEHPFTKKGRKENCRRRWTEGKKRKTYISISLPSLGIHINADSPFELASKRYGSQADGVPPRLTFRANNNHRGRLCWEACGHRKKNNR